MLLHAVTQWILLMGTEKDQNSCTTNHTHGLFIHSSQKKKPRKKIMANHLLVALYLKILNKFIWILYLGSALKDVKYIQFCFVSIWYNS
jgi:hypothetical protein